MPGESFRLTKVAAHIKVTAKEDLEANEKRLVALNEAAGYGHRVGTSERAARAVMALGQQMVADRQRPVPPVHRAAETEHDRETLEFDLTA